MIGELIGGRFEVERVAASGGMGRVYLAGDRHSGRKVALKVISTPGRVAAERFARESAILAELRHPGVVDYVAHGTLTDGSPYLVMEWLDGVDLSAYLKERGTLPAMDAVQIARRVAATLAAVHARGVVHRDVKPSNLFLPDRDASRVMLIDFGTARPVVAEQALTREGEVVGTPYYMAPEQVQGGDIGAAADIWGLGCVLYQCLTGVPPFASSNPLGAMLRVMVDEPTVELEACAGVPQSLARLVRTMLAKEPGDRPATEALSAALTAIDVPAQTPATVAGRSRRPTPMADSPGMVGEHRVRVLLFGRLGTASVDLAGMRKLAARYGADIQLLADDVLLIVHRAGEAPTDQAAHGALLALALKAAARDLVLVLATGRAGGADKRPAGAMVDEAVAALEQAAPGEIRVDRTTARLLEGRFEIEVSADRCLLVRRRAVEGTRTLLGKASPWVGRRRELAGLLATFDECVDSSVARAVLVTAPAGTGKSRLCSEMLRELSARGADHEILRGEADSLGAGSPFVMIAPAVRRSAGIFDGEPLDVRRAKLKARLSWSVTAADLARVVAFIGEMVGVGFPDDDNEPLRAARRDPMLLGELMRGAFCDWLRAECELRPVLFVLEDLHWGDAPSVSFLDAALRALVDRPFMVLALARPEVHAVFPQLWQSRELEEVRLHALSPKACAEIARHALGEDTPDAVVDALVARSQGNAFYLEEMVRATAEGVISQLPDTVIAMVQARLYALDPEARRVLRAASVFGEAFWAGGVRALCGEIEGAFTVHEWLGELVRLEVVNRVEQSRLPGEQEYRFRHALLRDGAYEMLVDQDRTTGHLRAAEWLTASGERDALMLAGHFERGGDREQTVTWLGRAADQALEANDLPAVIARAERAVAAGASGTVLGRLRAVQSVATFWLAHYKDSVRLGEEAADLLDEGSDDWFRGLGTAMISSTRFGDIERFERLFARAERAERSTWPAIICLARGGYQLAQRGLPERAGVVLARVDALLAASASDDPLPMAHVSDLRAIVAAMGGELLAGFEHTRATVEAFRRAGDRNNVCATMGTLAYFFARLGDFAGAMATHHAMLAEAEAIGSKQAIVMGKFGLGWALGEAGDRSAGRALLQESVAVFHAVGHRRFEGWALCALADVEHHDGQDAVSLELSVTALDRLGESPGLLGWASGLHSRALLACGRNSEALAAARRAVDLVDRHGTLWGDELSPLVLAQALRATGDHTAARAIIQASRDHLLQRLATLEGTPWRESYLTVVDLARTFALAADWAV